MKKLFAAPAIALLLLPLLLLSCSKKDSGTNGTSQITQEQAQQMQAMAAALVPLTSSITASGVTRVDGVDESDYDMSDLLETGDNVTVTVDFDPSGGWWDSFFSFSTEGDTAISLEMRDSVRFETSIGLAQQFPDDSTDRVRDVARVALVAEVTDLGYLNLAMRSDVYFSDLLASSVVVNGSQSLDLEADISTDEASAAGMVKATLEISDLVVPKPSFDGEITCPTSGEIVLMVTENLSAQAANQGVKSATWTITVTVLNANSYRIRLQGDGKNFGEVTVNEQCGSSLSMAKRFLGVSSGILKSVAPQQ